MNKVLIVSDSHGQTKDLISLKERHACTHYLHCGDSELQADSPFLHGYTVVKGNCDRWGYFPEEVLLEVGGLRVLLTHGHLFDVKRSLQTLQYRSMEHEADIVCFGHSHIAYAEKIGEQLFINPGSIFLPRKYPTPSYVLLDWEEPTDISLRFFHVIGDEITDFPYEKKFFIKK